MVQQKHKCKNMGCERCDLLNSPMTFHENMALLHPERSSILPGLPATRPQGGSPGSHTPPKTHVPLPTVPTRSHRSTGPHPPVSLSLLLTHKPSSQVRQGEVSQEESEGLNATTGRPELVAKLSCQQWAACEQVEPRGQGHRKMKTSSYKAVFLLPFFPIHPAKRTN